MRSEPAGKNQDPLISIYGEHESILDWALLYCAYCWQIHNQTRIIIGIKNKINAKASIISFARDD